MNAIEHARRVRHVRKLLSRTPAAGGNLALEAVAEPQLPHADDVLAQVESTLMRMPADEVSDPEKFRQALTLLLEHGSRGLRSLALNDDPQAIDGDALVSLEAIVVADGTRPSFLLRSGRVAEDHPFLGAWKADIDKRGDALAKVAAAVGRIQPRGGHASRYIGSGTLIDRAAGLVLTNYHVADDAHNRFDIAMDQQPGRWRVTGDLFIDFAAEAGSLDSAEFRVLEVLLPDGAGRGAGQLDAVVLRIDTSSGPNLPDREVRPSVEADFANGSASAKLCTIGIPGPPQQVAPEDVTIDWDFVVSTLFGNRFGLKRLAPGQFMGGPGTVQGDTARRILTHDATTFGGASGSLLFALGDPAVAAFGLHFAGLTGKFNQAVALAVAANALRGVGVKFLEDA